jgi:group I intron endonuclease
MSGIYKIISPNDRIYIGQSVNFKKRFTDYKFLKCKTQRRLYNSIIKYGYLNHRFEIVEECDINNLNSRERYWQEYYNVLGKKGLNCRLTKTDDKSGFLSESTKKRQSISQKNSTVQRKANKTSFKKGCAPWNRGLRGVVTQTLESNNKRSITCKRVCTVNKNVLQFTKTGHLVKVWSSARSAGITLGKQSGASITECCNGKRKSIYGFIWKYKKEQAS